MAINYGLPAPIQAAKDKDRRTLLAQALIQQGSSTAPAQNGTVALARALQGIIGGYQQGAVERDYQKQASDYRAAVGDALHRPEGGEDPGPQFTIDKLSASTNPYAQNQGLEMQQKQAEENQKLAAAAAAAKQKQELELAGKERLATGADLPPDYVPEPGTEVYFTPGVGITNIKRKPANNPNQPFNADGTPNTAFQNYETTKAERSRRDRQSPAPYYESAVGADGLLYNRDVRTGQVTAAIDPSTGQPLKAFSASAEAQRGIAEAKAGGTVEGRTEAEVQQAKNKTARDSSDALVVLDRADGLLNETTGSGVGALRDRAAGFFGATTDGAGAAAQLKVLSAKMVATVPRFEGPQSNIDVQLYKEAAGNLGDETLPIGTRRAALQEMRALAEKYANQGALVSETPPYLARPPEQPQASPPGISEADIKQTMMRYGLSRRQVLDRIGGQP